MGSFPIHAIHFFSVSHSISKMISWRCHVPKSKRGVKGQKVRHTNTYGINIHVRCNCLMATQNRSTISEHFIVQLNFGNIVAGSYYVISERLERFLLLGDSPLPSDQHSLGCARSHIVIL